MARAKGFLGNISGSVGDLVFYQVNGVTYIRQKGSPNKTKKKPSPLKKNSNDRFGITSKFLTPITDPINKGYGNFVNGSYTARHEAMSYISKNCLSGGGREAFRFEPHLIKVSRGSLTGGVDPKVDWIDDRHVKFTWVNNSGKGSARLRDQVMVVLYDFDGRYAESIEEGNTRGMEEQVIEVKYPKEHRGKMHAYISFHRHNKRRNCIEISDSQYVGVV